MRIGKIRTRREKQLILVACLGLLALLIFLVQSKRVKKTIELSTSACIGSETSIVDRSEDYVRKFVKRLAKEARRAEASEQV